MSRARRKNIRAAADVSPLTDIGARPNKMKFLLCYAQGNCVAGLHQFAPFVAAHSDCYVGWLYLMQTVLHVAWREGLLFRQRPLQVEASQTELGYRNQTELRSGMQADCFRFSEVLRTTR